MTDPEIIAGFENIPLVLRKALAGMTHEQLLATPVPGKWSTHDVAIHLADADAVLIHRLKRIIAEDRPTYSAWNENLFVSRLAYAQQLAEDAVQLIEIGHRQFARAIKHMAPGWLDRNGVHGEGGPETAREVLHKAVWHIAHHLKFVEEKRAKLGI